MMSMLFFFDNDEKVHDVLTDCKDDDNGEWCFEIFARSKLFNFPFM